MCLTFKTARHQLFVALPHNVPNDAAGHRVSRYAELIDETVDKLHALCKDDSGLLSELVRVKSRAEAYQLIGKHLKYATSPHPWLRAHAGSDLCRRVLFLLAPERFGFECHGWVH